MDILRRGKRKQGNGDFLRRPAMLSWEHLTALASGLALGAAGFGYVTLYGGAGSALPQETVGHIDKGR